MVSNDLILNIKANTSEMINDLRKSTTKGLSGISGVGGGKISSVQSPVTSDATKGIGGTIGKLLGPLGAIMSSVGIMTGGIMAIVSASKPLQGTLKILSKLLGLILKPIGDMLAIGLMPIIQILKPIGLLVNSMVKPYMQKARQAMRMGAIFQKEGKPVEAIKSYALGFGYLMKPAMNLQAEILTMVAKAPLIMFKSLGILLSKVGKEGGFFGKALIGIGEAMSGSAEYASEKVDEAKDALLNFVDESLDRAFGSMLGTLATETSLTVEDVLSKFGKLKDKSGLIMEGMADKISGTSGIMKGMVTDGTTLMGNFITAVTGKDGLMGMVGSGSELTKSFASGVTGEQGLGKLSIDSRIPMENFNNVVIGYLKDLKNEANTILSDAKDMPSFVPEIFYKNPYGSFSKKTDSLGQGFSSMYDD